MANAPALPAVFTALAAIAAAQQGEYQQHFDVVYAYVNNIIKVRAPSAAQSVASVPAGHPVYMVLRALSVASGYGNHHTNEQLVENWWQSDN